MSKSFRSHKIQFVALFALIFAALLFFLTFSYKQSTGSEKPSFWEFRSIDTMKYSRDPSREKLNDPTYDEVIDQQVRLVAETGASHVAIATPYDEEFLPLLKRWAKAARKYDLKIWFRGNWSGWEGWFDYAKIDRTTHAQKTKEFILNNPELFESGDVFSACPECENGGPGDPRMNGDAEGHKKFLITEYIITQNAFKQIGKSVQSNYNSMNGDVARLIMDRETTKALGGLVVVDHYVGTPEKLVKDIKEYAELSGGQVILGEFGAPIPDIHGEMSQEQQAAWIREALHELMTTKEFVGLNYWTGFGGSTELWNPDGTPRKAVAELTKYYKPAYVKITVKDELGENIANAQIENTEIIKIKNDGNFFLPALHEQKTISVSANGYFSESTVIDNTDTVIVLKKEQENFFFSFRKFLKNIFKQ